MYTKYKARTMNKMTKDFIKVDNKNTFTEEYIDKKMETIYNTIFKAVANLEFNIVIEHYNLEKPIRKILRKQGYSVLSHNYSNSSEISYYTIHWNWVRHFRYLTML